MDIADGPRPPESCAAVVKADRNPEQVMSALKAYASRALNETGIDRTGRRRWARHGSTRYLWTMTEIAAAVRYVANDQGEAMAVHVSGAAH